MGAGTSQWSGAIPVMRGEQEGRLVPDTTGSLVSPSSGGGEDGLSPGEDDLSPGDELATLKMLQAPRLCLYFPHVREWGTLAFIL